jgi:hypothetical protein
MNHRRGGIKAPDQPAPSRRDFLKAAGVGVVGTVVAGGVVGGLGRGAAPASAATQTLSLVATDGYATMPGRENDPLYIFGFRDVTSDPDQSVSHLIAQYKGHTQMSAPTLDFVQDDDMKITLTNLGLVQRPDLTDSHTIHWHGFDIPSPLNDGVPEVSVAVPIGKQLTYFYRPHREGTYMWHCHFEDVEHVQMGMTGIVFVRPKQDGTAIGGFTKFAYNDTDGSTGYHRHFAILLNEVWSKFHDGDRDIQETIPTDYEPQWFTLNGRCYPQTTLRNDHHGESSGITTPNPNYDNAPDKSQPNSSLIQANRCCCGWPTSATSSTPCSCPASGCTWSGRTRRYCATAPTTSPTGPTPCTSGRVKPATCSSTRPLTTRYARQARMEWVRTTSTTSRTGTGDGSRAWDLPAPAGRRAE